MPIRREHRFIYPIDWPQLSAVIRFGRAKGRCEGCGRLHGQTVFHLGDGRWWDEEAASWRDGAGQIVGIVAGADDNACITRYKGGDEDSAHVMPPPTRWPRSSGRGRCSQCGAKMEALAGACTEALQRQSFHALGAGP